MSWTASLLKPRPESMAYHVLPFDDALLKHSQLMQPTKTNKDFQQYKKKLLLYGFCGKRLLDMLQHTLKSVPSHRTSSNRRSTTVLLEKDGQLPLYNATHQSKPSWAVELISSGSMQQARRILINFSTSTRQ